MTTQKGNNDCTFADIEIGKLFWEDCGTLAKKVTETQAKYQDSDKSLYLFRPTDKVSRYVS